MTDSTLAVPSAAAAAPANLAELMQRLPGVVQGARWFWWIAALSAVSVACNLANIHLSFSLGLACTQVVPSMFQFDPAIALAWDVVVLAGFWFLGLKAQQGRNWAFAVGMVVYIADALIYASFERWLPVGFHSFVLFYIGKSFYDLRAAKRATGLH